MESGSGQEATFSQQDDRAGSAKTSQYFEAYRHVAYVDRAPHRSSGFTAFARDRHAGAEPPLAHGGGSQTATKMPPAE